ncbi:MAG: hypothetical protein NVS3B26_26520 [Mycobacteriales bacterium]
MYSRLAADPVNPARLVVSTTLSPPSGYAPQVFVSGDHGVSWRPTAAQLPVVAGTTAGGDAVSAITGTGALVTTWISYRSDTRGYSVAPFPGGLVVSRSADGGQHWGSTQLLRPTRRGAGRCSFAGEASMASRGRTVVVAYLSSEAVGGCGRQAGDLILLARSDDDGRSWRTTELPYLASDYYGRPAVTVDGTGAAIVVARLSCDNLFLQGDRLCATDHKPATLVGARIPVSGRPGRLEPIGPDFGEDGHDVAVLNRTGAIIAMATPMGYTFGTSPVLYERHPDGTWRRTGAPLPDQGDLHAPSLAALPDGSLALVGLLELPTLEQLNAIPVVLTTRDKGQTWSCPHALATLPTAEPLALHTSAVVTGDGLLHGLWTDQRDAATGTDAWTSAVAARPFATGLSASCVGAPVVVQSRPAAGGSLARPRLLIGPENLQRHR